MFKHQLSDRAVRQMQRDLWSLKRAQEAEHALRQSSAATLGAISGLLG